MKLRSFEFKNVKEDFGKDSRAVSSSKSTSLSCGIQGLEIAARGRGAGRWIPGMQDRPEGKIGAHRESEKSS